MSKERIKPAKLADAIADHLQSLILEGSLRTGDRLIAERDLAVKLDVSRPSLREALARLERQGMLESRRGGTYVRPVLGAAFGATLVDMLNHRPQSTYAYLEFRGILDGAAAYYAALRASEVDREIIAHRFAAIEAAHGCEDPSDEGDADAQFHLAVYQASHNIMMLHVMGSLSDLLRQDVFYNRHKLYSRKGVRNLLLDQHRAICEAIQNGDPEAARGAAEAHIVFTRTAIKEIDEADLRLEESLQKFAAGSWA